MMDRYGLHSLPSYYAGSWRRQKSLCHFSELDVLWLVLLHFPPFEWVGWLRWRFWRRKGNYSVMDWAVRPRISAPPPLSRSMALCSSSSSSSVDCMSSGATTLHGIILGYVDVEQIDPLLTCGVSLRRSYTFVVFASTRLRLWSMFLIICLSISWHSFSSSSSRSFPHHFHIYGHC